MQFRFRRMVVLAKTESILHLPSWMQCASPRHRGSRQAIGHPCSGGFTISMRWILLIASTIVVAAPLVAAQAPVPDSPAIEAKAHALLAKLTLEEKITLLGGVNGVYTQPMPAIGLPSLRMSDGPVGLNNDGLVDEDSFGPLGPSTAFVAGVGLAATWDVDMARQLGEAMGRNARARGVHFLLGPGLNIARSPVAGRNFEYLSEDPFLNSALAVPLVEGIQSQGVVATIKHYALNNEEFDRYNASADVDERTMREIYLPAFESSVIKGRADAVMNSYNLINGIHATESKFLNQQVLKGDWNFQGILMSDWYATHNAVASANNGLDLEMPEPRFMNLENLLPAVRSGLVKEATLDEKVLRLLRIVLRYGFLDRSQLDLSLNTYSLSDRSLALQSALESITLLKNAGPLLPLNPAKVKTIAVIGPDAYPAVTGGGGSSWVHPFDTVSLVAGIADLLGPDAHIYYSRGLPSLYGVFARTSWTHVTEETFSSHDFAGKPQVATPVRIASWKPGLATNGKGASSSIRYSGTFRTQKKGKYLLVAAACEAEEFAVAVDGKRVLKEAHAEAQAPRFVSIDFGADQTVKVVADYHPSSDRTCFGLGFVYEPNLILPEARQFASRADVVVVAVGFDQQTEGEGRDRTFSLPWGQDALIEAMAESNPQTIVTLTAGGAVDTRRWLDKVPALLHTYYPGQEGGRAVAEILFGKHNPEGKLPVSFDRSWEENPSYPYYYPAGDDRPLRERDQDSGDSTFSHLKYGDGLFVGYRYWTTKGQHPLFPFGFGLSYTAFRFSNLQMPAVAKTGSDIAIGFDVTNIGNVAGCEVAQLYVSDPSATVIRPERELKGFKKVCLNAGEAKHSILSLDARAFSYWSETTHKWTIDPGSFVIHVGNSSESTPLRGDLILRAE